ncbi:MAG: rRNA pseudouridine synthase [Erysipelotrichaceae bacterium]|nr:rRNA pseudouridine synthase [Erysipelotrichaceae bacterium]
MRLDKFLSNSGFGSRKDVKQLIKKKLVTVNDKIVTKSDLNINPLTDSIRYDNELIEYKEFHYFLLNKPKGYLSATEDNKQNTVLDLLPEYSYLNLFPVGRLDKDTTGTLLITDDGQLAHSLLSPKRHVDKIYIATLDKDIPPSIIKTFEEGIILDNELTLPAKLEIISSNVGKVTLHQGKYHQVKRMFSSFGLEVIELDRIQFSFLTVNDLPLGKYRELTKEEIEELLKYKR